MSLLLPLCLLIPPPPISIRPCREPSWYPGAPTKTRCQCNNHAPSRKKETDTFNPQRSASSPTAHTPAYFSHARKQPKQPPTLPSENMPRAPNTPLEKQIFSVVAPSPHGTPIAPTRRAMKESHISRLHVPQAIRASFSPIPAMTVSTIREPNPTR